jgi:hypothetical protein
MLRGARMVTASETEEGKPWAEARIKQMTGGDKISARFMRQDFFTFPPQFKLTIVGNYKPALQNVDEAPEVATKPERSKGARDFPFCGRANLVWTRCFTLNCQRYEAPMGVINLWWLHPWHRISRKYARPQNGKTHEKPAHLPTCQGR